MTTKEVISKVFKDPQTKYSLTEFETLPKPIHEILDIYPKVVTSGRAVGKTKYFLKSFAKFESGREEVQVYTEDGKGNPEEIVRQLWIYKLLNQYDYKPDQIVLEKKVYFGGTVYDKPCDIVVYRDNTCQTPKIIFEVKKPKRKDGIEQLKSYLNAEGSPIGVWSNGSDAIILYRPYPKEFDDTLSDIPKRSEEPKDVLTAKRTIADLKTDFNFKKIIQDLEELVLADSGVDEFNEIFKLIFAKIWDEKEAEENRKKRVVEFRKTLDPETTYDRINKLFHNASDEWKGVFKPGENIELRKDHLQVCIGPIEGIRLTGSNLRIMDDAFEYLLPTEAKKKKGQFFTPRHVIEMCVRMLNPKRTEYICDPACGSGGFLVHAMNWCYPAQSQIQRELRKSRYASKFLWGIDIETRAAKTARALMLIAGDGHTKVFGPDVNSLDPTTWYNSNSGMQLMGELRNTNLLKKVIPENETFREEDKAWEYFDELRFDVVFANPPFSGEIKDKKMLSHYQLAKPALNRAKNKPVKVERDILFLERIIKLLKPGGRAAVVLPQGQFNNASSAFIREYLIRKGRILAVVGLHQNTFKPHTGTKTSVLFFQKYKKAELGRLEEVRQKVAAKMPDYAAEINGVLEKAENKPDLEVENIPDHLLNLMMEEFGGEDPAASESTVAEELNGVENNNGNGDDDSSSDTGVQATEITLEERLLSADEAINVLKSQISEVQQQLTAELANTEKIKNAHEELLARTKKEFADSVRLLKVGSKNTKAADEKTGKRKAPVKNGMALNKLKTQFSDFKKKQKVALQVTKKAQAAEVRRLNGVLRELGDQLAQAQHDKNLLTNRGKLQLIRDDEELIGRLKERYIDTQLATELDYPIFMGVSEHGGKKNSGEYKFLVDSKGKIQEDSTGNPKLDQDLVDYDISKKELEETSVEGNKQVTIADAFVTFAKKQKLSFWSE